MGTTNPESNDLQLREIAAWILIVLPVLLLITGLWNLILASQLGQKEGLDLISLYRSWNQGIDISRTYSSIYVRAMKRLTVAIIQLSSAAIALGAGLYLAYVNKRNKEQFHTKSL